MNKKTVIVGSLAIVVGLLLMAIVFWVYIGHKPISHPLTGNSISQPDTSIDNDFLMSINPCNLNHSEIPRHIKR